MATKPVSATHSRPCASSHMPSAAPGVLGERAGVDFLLGIGSRKRIEPQLGGECTTRCRARRSSGRDSTTGPAKSVMRKVLSVTAMVTMASRKDEIACDAQHGFTNGADLAVDGA